MTGLYIHSVIGNTNKHEENFLLGLTYNGYIFSSHS